MAGEIWPDCTVGAVQDMSTLTVTELATQAHYLVIDTGMRHHETKDDCGTQGISRTNIGECPYYTEADILYTMLVRRGQKGAAH
jgi:hypothetical protein